MSSRGMLVSLAVAASLGLAACGEDKDKLSKSELASKASAICETAQAKSSKIEAPGSYEDPEVTEAYFNKIVPISQKQTDDLKALEPADDVKEDWDAVIDNQNAANDLLKTIRDKARAKDKSAPQDIKKVAAIGEIFALAAKKVGAATCAAESSKQAQKPSKQAQ